MTLTLPYATASPNRHVRYGSLFLSATGTYCVPPALGAWIANNTAPLIRRGTALSLFTITVNCGGILSTWLLGALSPPPRYTSATITLLVFQGGVFGFSLLTLAYLTIENKKKALRRAESREVDSGVTAMPGETTTATTGEVPNESAWFEYVL